MARKLEAFPETAKSRTYPWDEWTDGSVWEIKQGEDFTCKPHGLGLYEVAKSRGMKVKVHHPGKEPGTVVFQFYKEN